MNNFNPTLTLTLNDSSTLSTEMSGSYIFNTTGGVIGSSKSASQGWYLQDKSTSIAPIQATIIWQNDTFCLKDDSGKTRINSSRVGIGTDRIIRLREGDVLDIGDYKAHVHLEITERDNDVNIGTSLQKIITTEEGTSIDGLIEGAQQAQTAMNLNSVSYEDPLRALDEDRLDSRLNNDHASFFHHGSNRDDFDYAYGALSSQPSKTGGEEFLDMPGLPPSKASLSALPIDHVAISPLMNGLGEYFSVNNTQDAQDLLQEVGKTLKSAIEGLLKLQQIQMAGQNQSLTEKQLRPIEDNPLRLGLDYPTTINLLYAEKQSPVHLSAPMAVAESLNNIKIQHQANQIAINYALQAILKAFSPEALLRRFKHYRRSGEQSGSEASWAWEMYRHYYHELTSPRQTGFEKLFWEMYDQSFDRAVREQQEDGQ